MSQSKAQAPNPSLPLPENLNVRAAFIANSCGLLRTMSHPKRLAILKHLVEGEKSVGEIGSVLGISRANMAQHLARIRKAGLVATRREKNRIYYSLSSRSAVAMIETLQNTGIDDDVSNRRHFAVAS